MVQPDISSPYVGLRPFREEDYLFFFGRDREVRVISANLLARPLTVLYGPSGVGKSSVLQAGIAPRLKATHKAVVLYFKNWQSDSFLEEISRKCRDQVSVTEVSGRRDAKETLDEIAASATVPFYLLLDQFEEYLLYHPLDGVGEAFDTALARIVNREDMKANVLIGLREESLSKFDRRFSIRIPNLLGNTHEIERLSSAGATSAIQEPLRVFSQEYGNGRKFEIEPALTSEILCQVQTGQTALSESSGVGTSRARVQDRIETVFLQLVLSELWNKERRLNSTVLRRQTLIEIGGAQEIIKKHVVGVMSQLAGEAERDIAAHMFRFLVTPSRTKIAQATEDLVFYAEGPEQDVRLVLNSLTDNADARILRRLSNPEQYEIFHDILAEPILDWCRAHFEAKKIAELERQRRVKAEQQQRELEHAQTLAEAQRLRANLEARSARRWMVFALTLLVSVLAAGATIYAIHQKHSAEKSAEIAEARKHEVDAARFDAEAARAESLGNKELAQQLRNEADKNRQIVQEQGSAGAQKLAQAEDRARKAELDVSDLQTQLGSANQEIGRLREEVDRLKARAPKPQKDQKLLAETPGQSPADGPLTGKGAEAVSPQSGPPTVEWFAGGQFQAYDLFGYQIDGRYYYIVALIRNSSRNRLRLDSAYMRFQSHEVSIASVSELKRLSPSVYEKLKRLTGVEVFRPGLLVDGNSQIRVALFCSKKGTQAAPSTWKSMKAGESPPSAELIVAVTVESDPSQRLELTTAKSKAAPLQNPD